MSVSTRMRTRSDPLEHYRKKRNFGKTPEPSGELGAAGADLAFVIQKHAATRLHYDFRLELDGVMLSWAVPKGPSYDPKEKRMAIQVEDHPISYNAFEGTIPPKQYGAGTVIIWDRGTWQPIGDPRKGLDAGKLLFTLHGQKLIGLWELVRISKPGERQPKWFLFKKHDPYERPKAEYDVVTALPDSVVAKPLGPEALPQPRGSAKVSGGAKPTADSVKTVLARAPEADLPAKLEPQLATLATALPSGGDWVIEIKLDGYRLMTRVEHGKPRLITRGGHDWTTKMRTLGRELAALGLHSAWLDGEIVVLSENGIPSFNALQSAFDERGADAIVYFLFDVPFFEGRDLRSLPLRERRRLLKAFLDRHPSDHIRFSADFEADPAHVLESARKLNLEGLIAKRADAPYVSARSETWLKLKCRLRQEFVIGGFTDRGNVAEAAEVGSLLLGTYDDERKLRFVGGVGTGWDSATAATLKSRLLKIETKASPFADDSVLKRGRWTKRAAGSERWVKPQLVAEVSFAHWTRDHQIRHAIFEGLREDKPAREVVRESALTIAAPARAARAATKVSHPERIIDPSTGLTKLDLVRYYESVADWMVPHLKGRPCSLVRGPSGIAGELFFQKHARQLQIPDVKELDPALMPGHEPLLEVPSAKAIAECAQMNVIEFHTWNALAKRFETPDRVVFDIDPGEGVKWKQVQEAAVLIRGLLEELGLAAWLKTSGGKGLHVVVPLAPRHDWDTVKSFAQVVVEHLARVIPDRFVAKSGASNRLGKIFVDHLRNRRGATTAAAYSARARPGLGVSMPVPWEALDALKSGAQWTIATAREHLSFHSDDPWVAYWKSKQTLTRALRVLQLEPTE